MISLLLSLVACRGDASDAAEVHRVEASQGAYAWADYSLTTFELGGGFGLTAPDGSPARFRMLAPADPGSEPRGVLLFLHGGSLDDDSDSPAGELGYCGAAYAAATVDSQLRNSAMAHQAIELGWVLIIPENAFCDGWVGQGAEDPVDTAHGGFLLASLALEWALETQTEVPLDPARIHLVGSSMGAMGASWFASRTPCTLESAGFAHGSINTTRLYYEEGYNTYPPEDWRGRLDHTLGGPPSLSGQGSPASEWYPGYRDNSLELAVSEGDLQVPIFHLWSSEDPVSLAVAHQGMSELLEAHHGGAGIPWGSYDSGVHYHSVIHSLRYPYASLALLRFLDTLTVTVLEGEDGDGEVGMVDFDPERWAQMSGTAVRVTTAPGLLYQQTLTAPAGSSLRATFFLTATGDPTITLTARDAGGVIDSATLSASDLEYTEQDYPSMRQVMARTTLSGEASGELSLEVSVAGDGIVALDVIVLDDPT